MRHLPLPPLEMRELVGPTDLASFDNPTGAPIFPEVPGDAYGSVFDFGCGCGRTARQLIQQTRQPSRYLGIDVHLGMIKWCRRELVPHAPQFEFEHHNVYSRAFNPGGVRPPMLPFPTESAAFTLVNAHSVFTHLVGDQLGFYLRECARILSPTGYLRTTWLLFDKREFPMLQEYQQALYTSAEDPSGAVIVDRAWVLEQARACGLVVVEAIPPAIRGFQWVLFMRSDSTGDRWVELPPDIAPYGLARPPIPRRFPALVE